MYKNDSNSPRIKNKLYEILKEIFTGRNILDKFSSEFIESIISEEENYVKINYKKVENIKKRYQIFTQRKINIFSKASLQEIF